MSFSTPLHQSSPPPEKEPQTPAKDGPFKQKKKTHRVLLEARPQPLVGQNINGLKRHAGRRKDLHDGVREAALREVLGALDEGDDAVLGDEVVEGGLELRGEAGGAA